MDLLVSFSVDGELDGFNTGHLFVPDGDPLGYDLDDLQDEDF